LTDEESEEETRVVKSSKDKRFDDMLDIIKKAKNARKNKDFNASLTIFQDLTKAYVKSAKVIEKEGVPSFYVKELVELEDYINLTWSDKELKKKLSKDRARGLTTLRQRLKKYFVDVQGLTKKVEDFRLNPVEDEPEEEVEEVKYNSLFEIFLKKIIF
jgi:translation initiation factor 3 subunit C